MLGALAGYAAGLGLTAEPGFAIRKVRWGIHVRPDGTFVDLEDLRVDGSVKEFADCPHLTQPELISGGAEQPRSQFLIESAELVLDLDGDQLDPEKTQRRKNKREYFVGLVRKAGQDRDELAWLQGIVRFMQTPDQVQLARSRLMAYRGEPGERVIVLVEGRNPLESTDWHDWWRAFRSSLTRRPRRGEPSQPGAPVRDMLSGELVQPLATHPKLKGMAGAGGLPSGDALISFDKPAYQSYGLVRGANAPLSPESVSRYVAGLEHLLERGRTLANSKVCHWYHGQIEEDPLAYLLDPDGPAVRARVLAAEKGEARYQCLVVTGCGGRLMLRSWHEGSVRELQAAVKSWFNDLAIIHERGGRLALPPKLWAVLAGLFRDPSKELRDPMVADVLRAVLERGPLPRRTLDLALDRIRIDQVATPTVPFHQPRMGLIRAYLRRGWTGQTPGARLCRDHPDPAYHYGRLLALLSELERTAIPGIGAGSVARTYPLASLRPPQVIGRLLDRSRYHLRELWAAPARRFRESIARVVAQLQPSTLDGPLCLERQGLFALGYYQQQAERAGGPRPHRDQEDHYQGEDEHGPYPQI